ncbi:hypothetical protein [Halosimplex marinum]|uniref:hypothetical protein n=1 Tax=Halosimplex marinum TaxID=3396620 RepID=UPI003F551A2D
MTGTSLQLAAALEVIPPWLPTAAVAGGFLLLLAGLFDRLLANALGGWRSYSRPFGFAAAALFAASVAGATYVTVVRRELALLFALSVFVCGRCVQGAITARIVQKVLGFVLDGSGEGGRGDSVAALLRSGVDYLVSRLLDKAKLFAAVGVIAAYTASSMVAVFVVGDGSVAEALERFWIGVFFLTLAGVSFDARYFAHRVSWTATLGLVVATTGAVLYSPAGTSGLVATLSPYLQNPVPDWTKYPLGAVGFLFGVSFWSFFYVRSRP